MAVACSSRLRLRSALLAGDQDFSDGRGLGIGEQAVHVAHEVTTQRDEEEDAETSAGEADEDGLHRVGIEIEDVEGGKGEDGARHHAASSAADAGDDDVLKQGGAATVGAREANGEDGDGDRRLHYLADFEAGVGRSNGKDDAEDDAPKQRSRRKFGLRGMCGTMGRYSSPSSSGR